MKTVEVMILFDSSLSLAVYEVKREDGKKPFFWLTQNGVHVLGSRNRQMVEARFYKRAKDGKPVPLCSIIQQANEAIQS